MMGTNWGSINSFSVCLQEDTHADIGRLCRIPNLIQVLLTRAIGVGTFKCS